MDQSVSDGGFDGYDGAIGHVDLAHVDDFVLGPLSVAPARRLISGTIADATLEPKVMVVLVALARAGTRTLSKDDLIRQCWEGRIVGDASINRVISLLRTGLRDTTGDAVKVETIPKVGYRIQIDDNQAAEPVDQRVDSRRTLRPWPLIAIAAVVLAMLAAGAWLLASPNTSSEPIRIAMMPFEASEGTDEFFALGMTSELQSVLGQQQGMEVSVSDSAGQLLADGRSMMEIGGLLKAQYVLRGKVSSEAERTILTGELVNAGTGEIVWSGDVASSLESAQSIPIRASRLIATALGISIVTPKAGAQLSREDYALYVTAIGLIRDRGVEPRKAAKEILDALVQRNAQSAPAIAGLAKAYYLLPYPSGDEKTENWARAADLAERALAIDSDAVEALKVGGILADTDERRIARLTRATELDPGDPEAWWWLSIVQRTAMTMDDSTHSLRRVVSLDPLWVMAPAASETAALMGRREISVEMERNIAAAAVDQWQKDLSAARLAKMRGDLSEFVRLTDKASPYMNDGSNRTHGGSVLVVDQLLGIRSEVPWQIRFGQFYSRVERGELPTAGEFASAGVDAEQFWSENSNMWLASVLFVRDDREDELIAFYDAKFDSFEAFIEFFEAASLTNIRVPKLSVYLAEALERVGRIGEADQHRQYARDVVKKWEVGEAPVIMTDVVAATLAVIDGNDDKALRLLGRAIDGGWPYTLQAPHWLQTGPLADDPLWDRMKDNEKLRALLAPLRADLERERRETLALGRSGND
ncbi:hypothetical protein BPTFM16_01243 [Altererythrobacter insulae]|nr:hypothetical protein BPTFM16_01243 [Altererythrobacter insulae]